MVGRISKLVLVVFVVLGCTQFASATTITVGASGADYTDINSAIAAIAVTGTTVQMIDSGSYAIGQPALSAAKYEGLTIESAVGQKATITLDGAGGYGFYYGQPNMTLQNVKVVNNGRDAGVLSAAAGTVIKNVDFVDNVLGGYLLGAGQDMEVSYSTFYGTGFGSSDGKGISANGTAGWGLSVDHCSFDNLGFAPIHNGAGYALNITNNAFGEYYSTSTYRTSVYLAGTLTDEDYNVHWRDTGIVYYEGTGLVLPNGLHTLKVAGISDIFTGDRSAGDWAVPLALQTAASDGTAIGAWQVPEPATMSLLVIGGIALLRRKRS